MLGRAWNGAAIVAAVTLALPAVAAAGVATSDGGTARFADPAGANDVLAADLEFVDETPNVDPPGWSVSFLQFEPATTWGAGCQEGFVGTLCPFGASPPAAIAIDLGAGDDALDLGIKAATAPPTRITLAGGPGADRLATVRARAEIDGGDGDDVLLPDERWALDFPPDPTPGGVIRGGPGSDTVSYELALDPIDVSLDGVANDGRRGEGDNVQPDVEHVVGSQFGGTLAGSAAANRITGGERADRIDALDATAGDRVECGAGDDVALVDAGDAVAGDCEKLTWAPGIGGSALRFRGGRVVAALTCPKAASRCRGTVLLRAAGGRQKRLAQASYRIKRGKRATLRLKPSSAGRAAFKRRSAKATAYVQPAGATTVAGRSVTVRR